MKIEFSMIHDTGIYAQAVSLNIEMVSPTVLIKLREFIIEQVKHVTCFKCCKYFCEPETAFCGHSLCHSCWTTLHACPICSQQLNHKKLRLNMPLKNLTNNIHRLDDLFAQNFDKTLDDRLVDKDKTKNVMAWLTNSQNHFSEKMSQGTQHENILTTKVQVHNSNKNIENQKNIVYKTVVQENWDTIEEITEDEGNRKQENVIGPNDIEPFNPDEKEYSTENPRRSSRNRKRSKNRSNDYNSIDYAKSDSNKDTIDSNRNKAKENWNNVRKMKKEFNKVCKNDSNKLNVTIETCKNIKDILNKPEITANILNINNTNVDKFEKMDKKNTLTEKNQVIKSKTIINEMIPASVDKLQKDPEISHSDLYEKNNESKITENVENIQTKINDLPSNEEINSKKTFPVHNKTRMPFIKKSALCPKHEIDQYKTILNKTNDVQAIRNNSSDVEISIKVGNTITSIVIKKQDDVHFKVMTDQGVQTRFESCESSKKTEAAFNLKNISGQNIDLNLGNSENNFIQIRSKIINTDQEQKDLNSVSTSNKKGTASAETQTVSYVNTECVEKELENEMECSENPRLEEVNKEFDIEKADIGNKTKAMDPHHDFDIFDTESIKENDNLVLKHASSEIVSTTGGNRKLRDEDNKSQKRKRGKSAEDILHTSKKLKVVQESDKNQNKSKIGQIDTISNSNSINYDTLMSQVFANIDEDIEINRKSQTKENEKEKTVINEDLQMSKSKSLSKQTVKNTNETDDNELDFAFLNNKGRCWKDPKTSEVSLSVHQIDQLTPVITKDSNSTKIPDNKNITVEKIIYEKDDDSDKSVVEETPQKNVSIIKTKTKTSATIREFQNVRDNSRTESKIPSEASSVKGVAVRPDPTANKNHHETNVEVAPRRLSLETPVSINKFVGSITHRSTPVARKSLNFESESMEDPEQTLCQTVVKNTQEKELMLQAFESTPNVAEVNLKSKKYYVAGSCLKDSELKKVKALCKIHDWVYLDSYTKDLTHLVVRVDEENKSQRSVKYVQALAASKWIVSYSWVEQCLAMEKVVNEAMYEALDSTGEPGPRRSRTTKQKLFTGFKFYCMEPFSVLKIESLKEILESAGGQVVNSAKDVRITGDSNEPALLLAKPEDTQEDKFIYLAMELSIVPVNCEWVLNCLGSYKLVSIQNLLLCPPALLPPGINGWPASVLCSDND